VTETPQVRWGLGLKNFNPLELFKHARELTRCHNGFVLVSFPSEHERNVGLELAFAAGFKSQFENIWEPSSNCLQRKPRFGYLLR
jgi:hypothetical protein